MATLVFGLADNSRVKRKLSEHKLSIEQSLMAMIIDDLNFICWTYSREARKGKSYSRKSIYKALLGEYKVEKDELISFETPEEYEEYMKTIRGN